MRKVAEAFAALLSADANLIVFDGEVGTGKDEPERYVVFYTSTPAQERSRLSADPGIFAHTITTMSVGDSPNECRWVAEKVHAALTRKRPVIDGLNTSPVWLRSAGQVRRDDTTNPAAWIATDVWRFTTTR